VSRLICMIFVVDLIACRLNAFMSAVEWVPCVAAVYGARLLLLVGWCEGFYGVRVSEALAAYVVLVPFLLVE